MIDNIIKSQEMSKISRQGRYISKSGKEVDITHCNNKVKESIYEYNGKYDFIEANIYPEKKTKITVINQKAINTAFESEGKTAVLNFANGLFPGGAYRLGANAQEEDFFRYTNISLSINYNRNMYINNLLRFNRFKYSDRMVYSEVFILRDPSGDLVDNPVSIGVITSPAVAYTMSKFLLVSKQHAKLVMEKRIDKIMGLALTQGVETLILGAFGCGAYGNNKEDILDIFNKLMHTKYNDKFYEIIFSIYTNSDKEFNFWNNGIER